MLLPIQIHFQLLKISGAPKDGFLLQLIALKTPFRPSRVLLDLQKCTLSSAKKIISVWSSQSNLSLFEITRASVLFSRKFQLQLKFYGSENFAHSSLHRILESENFRFSFLYEKQLNLGSEMGKIKPQKTVGNLLDKLRKLYMNGTVI